MLGYRHDYLKFYQFPNSNLFTHRLLSFMREATSETYGPGSSFSYICLQSTFPLHFYSDLLNKNTKRLCCTLFYLRSIISIYYNFLPSTHRFWHRTPKGIDNPFNTWLASGVICVQGLFTLCCLVLLLVRYPWFHI